jgi:hypothetical protein
MDVLHDGIGKGTALPTSLLVGEYLDYPVLQHEAPSLLQPAQPQSKKNQDRGEKVIGKKIGQRDKVCCGTQTVDGLQGKGRKCGYLVFSKPQGRLEPLRVEEQIKGINGGRDHDIRCQHGIRCASFLKTHGNADPHDQKHLSIILAITQGDDAIRAKFSDVSLFLLIMPVAFENPYQTVYRRQFVPRPAEGVGCQHMHVKEFGHPVQPPVGVRKKPAVNREGPGEIRHQMLKLYRAESGDVECKHNVSS